MEMYADDILVKSTKKVVIYEIKKRCSVCYEDTNEVQPTKMFF